MMEILEAIGALGVIISALWLLGTIVVVSASVIFWIWMLIDAIKNQKEDKVLWILVILSLMSVGATIYFLVARKERGKRGK